MVACNGGGDSALTDPFALVMGRLKIHRLGGPLRGFVQQALKLARRGARREDTAMSRVSFFDFARSLTLSR